MKSQIAFPYFIAVLLFALLATSKYDRLNGFSELSGFGEIWEERRLQVIRNLDTFVKPNSGGYDGQFYVQIAVDPSLRDPELANAIDSPSYRARRILLPVLAYGIGFGQPNAIVQIYSTLNIAAWIWMGLLLLHWIPLTGSRNFAKWCTCMFSMGALESVRYSLADLPSLAIMLTTLYLVEKSKLRWGSLAFVLSVFSKETCMLNAVSLFQVKGGLSQWFKSRQNLWVIGTSLLSLVLYSIWLYYISLRFPLAAEASGNIGIPFFGIIEATSSAFQQIWSGNFESRFTFRLLAILGLLFQLGYLATKPNFQNPIWMLGATFGVLFLTLGENVWWGYWAACRIALPVTFAFAVLYNPKNDKLFYLGLLGSNLTMIHAVIRWL